ncbi:MAG: efflux RND transporter periplasmic adaptor subunit [Planctomycetota bacterium]
MGNSVGRSMGIILALLAGAAGVASDAPGPPAKKQASAVTVAYVTVMQRDVPIYLDGLGTVQAYFTVTVRPQIDGQLSRVAFKEGQDVHKGDLLAEIDPRPYQAQLDQAVARKKQDQAKQQQDQAKETQDRAKKTQDQALVKQAEAKAVLDKATLTNARLNLKRYQDTLATGGSSEQNITDTQTLIAQTDATIQADGAAIQAAQAAIEVDDAGIKADQSAIQADEATVQADEAAVKYAEVFLSYCRITSPLDGRTGVRLIDEGNIVHANDLSVSSTGSTTGALTLGPSGALVVVTQLEPISVIFTLPQQNLQAVNARQAQEPLPVLAVDPEGKTVLDRGTLLLVDNQIDPATGTMRLKATFPNARRALWPGGFVNMRLLLETRRGATCVAAPAVQQGPEGPLLYVIKPDQTVEIRPVEVTLVQDGEAVIKSGVSTGEQVVFSGHDRLKAGTHVALVKAKGDAESKPGAKPEGAPKAEAEGQPKAEAKAGDKKE